MPLSHTGLFLRRSGTHIEDRCIDRVPIPPQRDGRPFPASHSSTSASGRTTQDSQHVPSQGGNGTEWGRTPASSRLRKQSRIPSNPTEDWPPLSHRTGERASPLENRLTALCQWSQPT